MEIIRKALKREIFLQYLASAALLVFGMLLTLFTFQVNAVFVLIGIVLMVLGIKLANDAIQNRDVDNSRLMQLLLKSPRQIVWVYSVVTLRMPYGLVFSRNATIHFKLVDGNELKLSMPQQDSKEVLKMLNFYLPHATFGYSADREQWFIANPELLYKETGGRRQESGGGNYEL